MNYLVNLFFFYVYVCVSVHHNMCKSRILGRFEQTKKKTWATSTILTVYFFFLNIIHSWSLTPSCVTWVCCEMALCGIIWASSHTEGCLWYIGSADNLLSFLQLFSFSLFSCRSCAMSFVLCCHKCVWVLKDDVDTKGWCGRVSLL